MELKDSNYSAQSKDILEMIDQEMVTKDVDEESFSEIDDTAMLLKR